MTTLEPAGGKKSRGRKSNWPDLTLAKIDQYLVNGEHTMKEIAEHIGCPYSLVQTRNTRLKKILKRAKLVEDPDTGIMVHPNVVGARSGDL